MIVERKMSALKQSEIFESLSSVQRARFLGLIEPMDLAKHQALFSAGMPSRAIYIVESGSLRLTRTSPDGASVVILSLVGPGDMLANALWEQELYDCSAEALEETTVYQISRDAFESFARENAAFALKLIQLTGLQLRQAETRIEDLVFRQVPSRVAKLFISLAENHGKMTPNGIVLDLPLTHQEIADTVGSSRVTITQILNRFRLQNWLGIKCRKVTIKDIEALEDLVASDVHTRKRFRDTTNEKGHKITANLLALEKT